MRDRVEMFFDCSSPWTYLAFESLIELNERLDFDIEWRPILVGGLFNTINPSVYAARENPVRQKATYQKKDLQDWASLKNLVIGLPDPFPVNSVKVMRGAFVAIENKLLVDYARTAFQYYWSQLKDISDDKVIRELVREVGLAEDEFFKKIEEPELKLQLRLNTDELAERGGFGSPTFFLNQHDMYFGNDRVELLRQKLLVN
jgi:2-hydroxychromene-2-carboxylate isomerase